VDEQAVSAKTAKTAKTNLLNLSERAYFPLKPVLDIKQLSLMDTRPLRA
jgi:hypothetical protein